jgi:hypothetical protein
LTGIFGPHGPFLPETQGLLTSIILLVEQEDIIRIKKIKDIFFIFCNFEFNTDEFNTDEFNGAIINKEHFFFNYLIEILKKTFKIRLIVIEKLVLNFLAMPNIHLDFQDSRILAGF